MVRPRHWLDAFWEEKCDLSDLCWDPKPRPTPYGEQDDNGVDVSLIRSNLRRTPLDRVLLQQSACRQAIELQKNARRTLANGL